MNRKTSIIMFVFAILTFSIGTSELMARSEIKKPTSGQCTYSEEIKKPFERAVAQGIFQWMIKGST